MCASEQIADKHVVAASIKGDEKGTPGTGGMVELLVDGELVGKGDFGKQVPMRFTVKESFDVGCDTVTPVSDLYMRLANFTGPFKRVDINISGKPIKDLEVAYKIAMATQ